MSAPKFSVVLIARNEAKTLPRLIVSLKEFQERGGEIVLVDTGSTDGTAELARSLGCKVTERGDFFSTVLTVELARKINERFVVQGPCGRPEPPVVQPLDRLFDFASARNYAATLASNDAIATPDCDEVWTKLDLDRIDELIGAGTHQFEYNFVYAHDAQGNEAIKFLHSKFYDRRRLRWVGIVHEVLQEGGTLINADGALRREFLPESVAKLEHWQNPETNRSGYLRGLALDCYLHPDNNRNSHYLGRELMYTGRYKSAIRELIRHIAMNRWPAEQAQSMIFIGDCVMKCRTEEQEALKWYFKAFVTDGGRREALIRLAEYYYGKPGNKPEYAQRAAAFAEAALTIPHDGYYACDMTHYRETPHEILYWAYWVLTHDQHSTDLSDKCRYHYMKALEYAPENPKYQADAQFFKGDAEGEVVARVNGPLNQELVYES